ncbi:pentapeptide repeat-containing protein [Tengunoibacter tsumagoiensis]|uniref:Pentapeptide repeat protein n=1 Tax=Tengunoibacter tsumagoiensis TaxID=2014871 RepID=A0A401ZVZ3_9CHLR|nr:pentapeptide repeat-containing protein [Tengunoibacter tsumagoiensis]GCE11065.1 hypothetical protein KTT_09240 [Tengunoibacter tsumagoiensis]
MRRQTTKTTKVAYGLKAPDLPAEFVQQQLSTLVDCEYYARYALSQSSFSGQKARNISFEQSLFKHVDFTTTNFPKIHLVDCRCQGCDLANAEWMEANFHRVELRDCHLTGLRTIEAQFQDTIFHGCSAAFAQMAQITCKQVRFEECDLSEANFYEADLSGVLFVNCNLTNADLTKARLTGADLRGCKIDGMRIGPTELKGATIDMTQALAFVRSLGIQVATTDTTPFE